MKNTDKYDDFEYQFVLCTHVIFGKDLGWWWTHISFYFCSLTEYN